MSDDSKLRVSPSVLPQWNAYVRKWHRCGSCALSAHRSAVCHLRGSLPCRILYVGEAPGEAEDIFGYPFIGPAGKLLDSWLSDSRLSGIPSAFTNIVGCIPYKGGADDKSPPKKAIKACEDRLVAIIRMAQPSTIVAVGAIAEANLPVLSAIYAVHEGGRNPSIIKIPHPASVLKSKGANQAVLAQKAMLTLEKLAEKYGVSL
jgi:uracil-DNA glycosylase family 4